MTVNTPRSKGQSILIVGEGQCFSSSIYSYQNFDEILKNSYKRIHPQISHSNSDLSQPPEERELDKVNKIISRLKTQQQINQLALLMSTAQFPSIKNKIREFFLSILLRPSSQEASLPVYDIIQEFHNFFPYFEEEDQVELLDALASILLQVTPNQSHSKNGTLPSFDYYTATVNACTSTLKTCIQIDFPKQLTIAYIKSVLQTFIKVASNLSELSRNLTSNAIYIGEFFPFVAETEIFIKENDQELNRLIQQFLITAVLFTVGSPSILWSDSLDRVAKFMPPLIQRKPKIDFSSTKVRIQELLSLYKPQFFQKSEDVVPLFTKLLPGIPPKALQQLDLADIIYVMSIFYLETMRAERGIFGPILEYLEVEYNPSFTTILDAMLEPLLNKFYRYLDEVIDLERRSYCVAFTMNELLKRYLSPNDRIITRINPILTKFASYYPIVICNVEVLQMLGQVLSQSSNGEITNQQSLSVPHKVLDTLVRAATEYVPNAFYASLFHSQVEIGPKYNSSYSLRNNTSFHNLNHGKHATSNNASCNVYNFNDQGALIPFISRLPENLRSTFMKEFIMKSVTSGQAMYASPDSIMNVQDEHERTLLVASYIIQHPESELLSELIHIYDPHSLMLAWSHVTMKSVELSKLIIPELITAFVDSATANEGIFASELNENKILFQTTLLHFFVENITLRRHYADYLSLLTCGMNHKFLSHSAILPATIAYAYLGCLVMKTPFQMSARLKDKLQQFILKLALTAYSFTYDDYVLKYVSERELFLFEAVIFILPEIFESNLNDKEANPNSDKSTGSFGSSTLSSTLGRVSKGSVSKSILAAASQANRNYLTKITNSKTMGNFANLVAFLLCDQLQIMNAFLHQNQVSPSMQRLLTLRQVKPSHMHFNTSVKLIWKIAPEALYPFCKMTRVGSSVMDSIASMMEADSLTAPNVPMLATLYALYPKCNLNPLAVWRAVPGNKALSLLNAKMMNNKISASYVSKCFQLFSKRESLLFLPQLVQSLRFDSCGILQEFLTSYCKQSEVFCHYLLWNILSEKNNPVGANDNLPKILKKLEKKIIKNMNEEEKSHYENEFGLIDKLDEVSTKLLPMDIDKRPPALGDMLSEMELPKGLYIPSNPNYKIISIDAEHSVPLKSHARVPILVRFTVYDEDSEDKKPIPFSCIFKIMDDVRQDAMMIQFIDMTKQILNDAGIDHFLFPYRVFATGTNRGVIECIHNAKSRHDLGVSTQEDLLKYFINKYGQVGTPEFQRAQDNFIKSVAPYSLICYLFQVKDRHNANIMIDDDGHVIHIDFGFIFEISPGGNMKFERSPFKLTKEMIDVMGGSKDAPAFQRFVKLLTQCFFAVRARHEELEAITYLMMNAGFPCFLSDSIKKLQGRLFLEKSAKETCTEILKLVDGAYEANSTTMYDAFQKAQNDIYF
ncbi:Phosphatidylinositol 3- and 4-kinase family protein [Tritrichomonas foetus]|uniref:Phosphatidylinositol 3- and 4-kinase family protein n=1 Tax=Tritrichomonas foetus TaxID=1144522 RepID=A0A1J4L1S9_9EUKA|nr:Phosphatidylinositol 3- and 4-kinase family protein [Tritrichomonas foetus]|eukprot:OHT15845.1 Phosphatidylinositol 3- and 4-kinase family protein [Tritrichomonas foetus]